MANQDSILNKLIPNQGTGLGAFGTPSLFDNEGNLIVTDEVQSQSKVCMPSHVYHHQPVSLTLISNVKIDDVINFPLTGAQTMIKISILLLYRRIFATQVTPTFRRVLSLFCILIGIWGLTFLLLLLFNCGTHFEENWDYTASTADCLPAYPFFLSFAGTDVATDILILGLPIYMVGRLQMQIRVKLGVIGVFMLGIL